MHSWGLLPVTWNSWLSLVWKGATMEVANGMHINFLWGIQINTTYNNRQATSRDVIQLLSEWGEICYDQELQALPRTKSTAILKTTPGEPEQCHQMQNCGSRILHKNLILILGLPALVLSHTEWRRKASCIGALWYTYLLEGSQTPPVHWRWKAKPADWGQLKPVERVQWPQGQQGLFLFYAR